MPCELLDFRCWIVNEIVGDVTLAVMLMVALYFVIASKIRLGFDATIVFSLPLLLIFGMAFGGFSAIFAFATILAGILLAWIFDRIIGNK